MFNRIKDIIFKIKDYDRLEYDYSAVLCHFTVGRLSKTGYEINGLLTQLCDLLTEGYNEGYEDAEKDLALTWEDMALAFKCVNAALDDCDGKTREEVLKDALRRFNEQRQK